MELYSVTTIAKEYDGRKDVAFNWFYGDWAEGHERRRPMSRFGVPYANLIMDYRAKDENIYAEAAVDEYFTADEAAALKEYLDREHRGAGVTTIRPAHLPVPHDCMGFGAMPVGGGNDFYVLHKEEAYSLPFKAEGYFDLFADTES